MDFGDVHGRSLAGDGRQFESSSAVAQLLHMRYVSLVEHGEKQVAHRRAGLVADMPSALDAADAVGEEQQRQIREEVQVAVADRTAVENERVIKERAVAIRRIAQLVDIIGQHLGMEDVDLNDLRDLLRIALVMGDGMMGVAKSELR